MLMPTARPHDPLVVAGRVLKWIGIVLGSLIVLLLLALAFMDWNLFKHPIERIASAKMGRSVTIAGDLTVHPWSLTPTVIVNGLTLGDPPWEANRPMAKMDRLEVQLRLLPLLRGDVILPRLALVHPDVYLHQDRQGRANWTFENKAPTNQPASGPTHMPAIQDFLIDGGKLTWADDLRRLKVDGTIQAHEKAAQQDPQAFRIEGHGTINQQPFEIQVAGGPLINLDPEHPYPFNLTIKAGDIEVQSDGRVLKPFDLGGLDFNVSLRGQDLAEGFYLTQLALPNTAPFDLRAHIARRGKKIAVTDIAGKVGGSDLTGKLDIDATRKRPFVTGDLVSHQLRMKDLAASLGARPQAGGALAKNAPGRHAAPAEKKPAPPANARLFPDAHLQVDRVRAMDADVRFRASSIEAGIVPLKQVAFRVRLDNGVLTLDPFSFDLPEGKLAGLARIDARQDVPRTHLDVRMRDIQLAQLKGKTPGATPPLGGVMQARAVIDGSGDSVHQMMSDANGTFTAILPNGEVRAAFAELTGINIAEGLGLLLAKPKDNDAIRCGVVQFGIHDGVATADTMTIDTQNVLISGHGNVKLGPEVLDLEIKGEPKKLRLTRLRSPIEVKGHLMKPSIGLNVASTVKQGAIAAALGTLLTPAAAVLAFVDPGLAKDQNCAGLIEEANHRAGPAKPTAKPVSAKPAASGSSRH